MRGPVCLLLFLVLLSSNCVISDGRKSTSRLERRQLPLRGETGDSPWHGSIESTLQPHQTTGSHQTCLVTVIERQRQREIAKFEDLCSPVARAGSTALSLELTCDQGDVDSDYRAKASIRRVWSSKRSWAMLRPHLLMHAGLLRQQLY